MQNESNSGIRDNHEYGTVASFLQENIENGSQLSIVSAYFTIYAYEKMKESLNSIEHLRFLFGEPSFVSQIDPERTAKKAFRIEEDTLVIANRLEQKRIANECADWIREKVEIRSVRQTNLMHGKMYHIANSLNRNEALIGSSNFTMHGLGLSNSGNNLELNMIASDKRDITALKAWFDTVWQSEALVQDVKTDVLKYLEQLYAEHNPEFIYFKTLFHIFENYLSEQQNGGLLDNKTGFFETEIWNMLYDFQKDGVTGAINKILKYRGCIIADSVGLGKTFEALAVIKYFEALNDRVLVVCPKKLSGNWTIYQKVQNNVMNPFKRDQFHYTVLYHTDMGRTKGKSGANSIDFETFNWDAFDLVVIDESHNFRGNPQRRLDENGEEIRNRALWLMEEVIKASERTKVLMLSATPVNNTLKDLRNQIAFITKGKDDALSDSCGIADVRSTLETAQKVFTLWAGGKKRLTKELLEKLDSSFFKLLDALTIARSRKHITSYYRDARVGEFPKREKAISVYSDIDKLSEFPTYDKLNEQIIGYKLSVFNPSAFVREQFKTKYGIETKEAESNRKKKQKVLDLDGQASKAEHFTQNDREYYLIGMIKIGFLKRLESSVASFAFSMDRTIRKIEKLENLITLFKQTPIASHSEKITIEVEIPQDDEDDGEESEGDIKSTDTQTPEADTPSWEIGKKLKYQLTDLDLEKWEKALAADKKTLIAIRDIAKKVTSERDAKLAELKSLIKAKNASPLNASNRKVIIFTAFFDTAQYLYNNICPWAKQELGLHSALVGGSKTETTFGVNKFEHILVNFSPLSKNREQMPKAQKDGEIDILIATDCISEGQDLQDCDYLINYDIHWNPVRIIQRFGRIDRLGSRNKRIQLVNFWPTDNLEKYINLKDRVEARMALVDLTATGEENILNSEQVEELIQDDDLKYRCQQLKKLQKEVLDIEELDDSVSLTDFTLDDFRVELMKFIQSRRKELEAAPKGLYAVVPALGGDHASLFRGREITQAEADIVKPGVIFCLAHKKKRSEKINVNPLDPYFLVYIRDDKTIRYSYTHPKQILEIYRSLCQTQTVPFKQLYDLFNTETKNGSDTRHYSELLSKAGSDILRLLNKRIASSLTGGRSGIIPLISEQLQDLQDFELVTWLILK